MTKRGTKTEIELFAVEKNNLAKDFS